MNVNETKMSMSALSPKRLFIFAGELSGDLHGSHLIQALQELDNTLDIQGVCGPAMRSKGIKSLIPMEKFSVMGLTDVILALPALYRQFYLILNHLLEANIDAVILIDYPGFNLRLAKALRKSGYQGKIIQYVSPSVWAWGKHRIEIMEKNLDLLLTIYPFEKQYFLNSLLHVEFIGNPLCEYVTNYSYDACWKNQLSEQIDFTNKKIVSLFPGSRPHEIQKHLPLMIDAAIKMHTQFPEMVFGISHAGVKQINLPKNLPAIFFIVPKKYTYELMRASSLSIAKSGTVTLELALHKCPTVVMYQLSVFNRLYAKYFLKVSLPYYCIVNILASKLVFPELIEKTSSPTTLFEGLKTLYKDESVRKKCLDGCIEIEHLLNIEHPSQNAAKTILRTLSC